MAARDDPCMDREGRPLVNSPDPVQRLLDKLQAGNFDPKPTGPDSWESRCPGHNGSPPHPTIKRGDDGKVLLFCHHSPGCTAEVIVQALGLEMGDLFPGTNGQPKAKGKRKVHESLAKALNTLTFVKKAVRTQVWTYRAVDGRD